MNVRPDIRMDKNQFFRWLERQERRCELADGRVVLLPFVTRNHGRIAGNVFTALANRLDPSRFDVMWGDFAVETGDRSVRYADVMAEPFGEDGKARSTTNALLLVEVLSSSTMHVDFGEKREEYLSLPMLETYLICAQDEARVWAWTRQEGRWPDAPDILEELDATAPVPILDLALPLAEIYRNIALR